MEVTCIIRDTDGCQVRYSWLEIKLEKLEEKWRLIKDLVETLLTREIAKINEQLLYTIQNL